MASVNKVIVVGHLGQDPSVRYLPSGEAVANFSVATSSKYKNKSAEVVEEVEWHRCSVFGKLAEICEQYLLKGSLVYIEGRLKTRKWTDNANVERYSTEINVREMTMLGGRPQGDAQHRQERPAQAPQRSAPGAAPAARQAPAPRPSSGFDDMDDDIPFITASAYYDMTTSKARRMARYSY